MCFNEDWRYQFTLANKLCLLEPPRWAPEGRKVSHWVVIMDRFHCKSFSIIKQVSPIMPCDILKWGSHNCLSSSEVILKYMGKYGQYLPRVQGSWGQHGPTWGRRDQVGPCWPREPCYLGNHIKHGLPQKASITECNHDDVIKWKHFPRYWPFVWGIPRSPVNSPYKGQWRGDLMFPLICAWMNGWVNTRKACE